RRRRRGTRARGDTCRRGGAARLTAARTGRAVGRDVVWLDGRLVAAARATIPASDRGFLYGDAVFETVRAYGGELFLWRQHHRRLTASLRAFAIAPPRADLRAAAHAVLRACGLADGAVRITVSRGSGEGLLPARDLRPTLLISAREVPAELSVQRERGVAVVLLPFGHGRGAVTDGHKTTAYLPAVLAKMRAAARRAFEGVYVERDGMVSEGATSNLFAVRRGRLLTPPLEEGCLPGVTRAIVLRLAADAGIASDAVPLAAASLHEMDEVFLTASTIELMPVVRVDGARVADGAPGAVTRLLQERYRAFVARTLARTRRQEPS
ncbi:MAG: aminotransferase class IV, partial [Thermodesulfobacteriota bacterium]